MRLTVLQNNETSLSALAERIYPNLTDVARKKAEAALARANPQLAAREALRPGTVVTLPDDAELRPRPGTVGKDPVAELLEGLKDAVSAYHDDLVNRLDESITDLTSQEKLLSRKEVLAAIKADPAAGELAKRLAESLQERKKIATEEKKAHDAMLSAMVADIGAFLP
jgi:hypothetical protein